MNPRTITRTDRASKPVELGQTVYLFERHTFGIPEDDYQHTGIRHVAVTLSPRGEYPFFTLPEEDLSEP